MSTRAPSTLAVWEGWTLKLKTGLPYYFGPCAPTRSVALMQTFCRFGDNVLESACLQV